MGVDMADQSELIAANKSVEEIREMADADSLGFLSVEGLLKVAKGEKDRFCDACFTGNYPVPVQLQLGKLVLES